MNEEAASGGARPDMPGDPPTLGEPAPAPADEGPWGLDYGPRRGTRTPLTFRVGGVRLYHEELNVASAPARERFARGSIRAAQINSVALDLHPDEIIDRLVLHSAAASAASAPPPPDASADRPSIANHARGVALGPAEIDVQLAALAPGWPKRVGDHLFVADPRGLPEFLDSPTKLMSWMDEFARVDWPDGPTLISEGRYHTHLLRAAERHEGIEVMPHQPPISGIYYMTPQLPGATESAGALDEFVDFFRPETSVDRELIKAMAMTPAWGGPNGGRPAFLVTSPEGAPKKGTGRGKSTLVQRIAQLHGGGVSVAPGTSIEALKTRLLSPAARSLRVLVLDNVKTHRLSWGELEGLITEETISGRENYVGEGRRPNTLTTLITLNGARLSTDLARRVVAIVMGQPEQRAGWEEDLARFLEARRWHVLADIRSLLAKEPPALASRLGYAPWEAAVLAHVADPEACQDLILRRRERIDVDQEERDSVLAMFRAKLEERGLDPETTHVTIGKAEVAGWLTEATREHFPTVSATNHIRLMGIGQLRELHTRTGDTWVWRGERATSDDPKPLDPLRAGQPGFGATRSERDPWRTRRRDFHD